MKYCFCSCYIGELDNFQKCNFDKVDGIDYFLFTNLPKEDIKDTSWDVVVIKENENIKSLRTNTHISRYYKFQLHKVLNKSYDFVFYMDHYVCPLKNVDWNLIAEKTIYNCSENKLAIVQKRHCEKTIKSECNFVVSLKKETLENMKNALSFMKSLNPAMNLNSEIIYVENCIFGYCTNHKNTIDFFDKFWKLYNNPAYYTYRDQPLWNFAYQYYKKECQIEKLQNYIKATNLKQFNIDKYNNKCML